MNLNRKPAAIAQAAAEEIRALNHRTLDEVAFEEPADVYRAIDSLRQLLQYMPQAIEQTWKHLRNMEQDEAIRMDNGADLSAAMEEARQELNTARQSVASAANSLSRAAQPLSHMGGQW